ncbi:tyrosine-type recombinase/integrase [Actinoallomurus rhizosphaericola]|uniref:tyrosine-type recombinase/integrase n=1 Tax=Actinoallomurus rhizosphaericola TaxID=2952536 RepID=UPI0020932F4A|nr:site-specific integrase [Actinoallomurus rhizosphaericola]MCO6000142.1 site-specific integrase [Actinoallomurus rhizosphaericola]
MPATTITTPEEPERRKPSRRRTKKRANGEGTIVQRKDGRYEAKVFVLTTAGTFKRLSVYGKSREECHAKYVKLKAQADEGIPVASESWTVEQYLTYWLEHVVRVERRPKTYQGYEGVVRRYLIPELGKKRLGKLSARDVRLFITRVREACQCCRHGWDASREIPRCCAKPDPECCASRLSVRMVQSIHAVLRNALETAVREEIMPRNVAKLVKVSTPKYKVNRGLSVAQARAVLDAAYDERLYALYVLALCLGLRRGELLGLRWSDINLDAGTLEVVHALQRVGGELRFVRPKTDDSQRTIPLPTICVDALLLHRDRQKAERADAWPNWQENDLVFPSRLGKPLEPDNLRRSWGRIRKAAGLGDVRFHDIRHTCVSLLLDLGVPPHIVRDIVGHSDIEVTMTIYAHAALDEKRKALRKLGDALG